MPPTPTSATRSSTLRSAGAGALGACKDREIASGSMAAESLRLAVAPLPPRPRVAYRKTVGPRCSGAVSTHLNERMSREQCAPAADVEAARAEPGGITSIDATG